MSLALRGAAVAAGVVTPLAGMKLISLGQAVAPAEPVDVWTIVFKSIITAIVGGVSWAAVNIWRPYYANKTELQKKESEARIRIMEAEANSKIKMNETAAAAMSEIIRAVHDIEVGAERRHGEVMEHIVEQTSRARHDVRNVLTSLGLQLPPEGPPPMLDETGAIRQSRTKSGSFPAIDPKKPGGR